MPTPSEILDKLILACKKNPPSIESLKECCAEIQTQYQFDTVFIASARTPEEELAALASAGAPEVVDASLYRLGVEEKIALTRLPIKVYTDITGKPTFNQYGSLRMQKPKSAMFMVYNTPGKEYLLLGCGHMDSRTYALPLVQDVSQVWTMWKELVSATIEKSAQAKAAPPPPPTAPPLEAARPAGGTVPAGGAMPVPTPKGPEEQLLIPGLPHRATLLVDEVTRLYNRSYFDESLAVEVERARRYSRSLCLLILTVGSTESASVGDENLVAAHIAEVLIKSLRRVDVVCRVDKNQYAMILPDTATNTCGIIAKRIFKFFKLVLGTTPSVYINLSASSFPENSTEPKGLYDKALELLQQARQAGPNKAVLSD
ncbi:MAG TPA: GGDEF domain-containing protein [bacterium]|nr:GGDEF domain-containing protein [bacterium]